MKRIVLLLQFCLMVSAQTLFAEEASWTYDSANGKISNGVWTFGATLKAGTKNLYIDCSEGSFKGTEPCPIDFSTGIKDLEDNDGYTVVSFKKFSASSKSGGNMREFRGMMSEFVAPDCVSIGESGVGRDFCECTNLTKAVFNKELKIR